ncbi:MAG TPA: adenylyltransferase/cytidyltransferase family protein, partial [Chitinophagales bacterium]|nr:adenylyltransferase/cytidyltransferase family protein [Chitinophagales bacterium]
MKVFYGLDNLPEFKHAVLTIGTYDGVHFGHQQIIKRLNELATNIRGESILLTFDPHPRLILNPDDNKLKLISTIDEKIELLASFGLHLLIDFAANFTTRANEIKMDSSVLIFTLVVSLVTGILFGLLP